MAPFRRGSTLGFASAKRSKADIELTAARQSRLSLATEARSVDPIAADGQLRKPHGAVLTEILGHRREAVHADDGAAPCPANQVIGNERRAGPRRNRDRDADVRLTNDVAGHGHIPERGAPAEHDPGERGILNDVSGHRAIGFDTYPDAVTFPCRSAAAGSDVANDVALDDREPAAFAEIGDRYANAGTVDMIVSDDGAFEAGHATQCGLASVKAVVADDLNVGCRIAAEGGERAAANLIAAHHHIAGALDADPVSELIGSAVIVDVFDPVVDDEGAVFAGILSQDRNAVVARSADGVAGDHQSARVPGENGDIGAPADGRARHFAPDRVEQEAMSTGPHQLAIRDLDAAAVRKSNKCLTLRQGRSGAVEDESGEPHAVGLGGFKQRAVSR